MGRPATLTSILRQPQEQRAPIDSATLDLLESWRCQDATEDPAELQAAEEELAEFKKAMNRNRTLSGESIIYP